MTVNSFIPSVWSESALRNLHKALVWGQDGICNTDYEGDIKGMGSNVRINAIGPITIRKFSKNTDIASPDVLTDAQTVLTIDQGDYFNFGIDDVDKAQSNVDLMNEAMYEAAYAIAQNADSYISGLVANVAAANIIGSDGSPKTDLAPSSGISKAYDYLVDLVVLLKNANVPTGQLWAIVPPFFHGLLQKDDRFVRYGTDAQQAVLKNGIVGRAAGVDIYESNNVLITGSNVYNVTAGYPGGISFADQFTEMIAYRPEKRFGDAVKALHVYGAKVVRPQGIAVLKCQDPGF